MANREVTLVILAKMYGMGKLTLDQAVQYAGRLDQPTIVAELGHDVPYGGRAYEGNSANSIAAVMGLVGHELTLEQAHEFVSAVAASRAS